MKLTSTTAFTAATSFHFVLLNRGKLVEGASRVGCKFAFRDANSNGQNLLKSLRNVAGNCIGFSGLLLSTKADCLAASITNT
jgi:hypothetical protein